MRSPGAPSLRNEIERLFWEQIATGITSEKAAEAVGVSSAVGTRWFHYRGGMPLFMSNPISGRYRSRRNWPAAGAKCWRAESPQIFQRLFALSQTASADSLSWR